MAFVIRSPKLSYFNQQEQPQYDTHPNPNTQTTKSDKRIHINKSEKYIYHHRLGQKKIKRPQYQKNVKQSQIEFNNKILHFYQIQKTQKLTYNFNKIKKTKIHPKISQTPNLDKISLPQTYYQIPSTISQQTMVKYVPNSQSNRRERQQSLPGPGTYENLNIGCTQGTKFCNADTGRFEEMGNKDHGAYQTKKEQKQNYPIIRYHTMNTSNFKKSPNLINYWNNVLLKKLFHHKSNSNKQLQQSIKQQQYENKKDEETPNFTQNYSQNRKKGNSCPFAKAQRFHTNTSQSSNCFYQLSPTNPNKPNKQHANFLSQVQRFDQSPPRQSPLQYYNSQKSFLHPTKNRKYIGFDSNTEKSSLSNKIDLRPYYDIKSHDKKAFVRFSEVEINRCDLSGRKEDTPSPVTYDVTPNWNLENKCVIYRQSTPKFSTKSEIKAEINQKQQTLLVSSPTTNNPITTKPPTNNKPYRPKPAKPKIFRPKQFIQFQQFYDVTPQWQKKSYNRYFSDEILSANNPIQNKIF